MRNKRRYAPVERENTWDNAKDRHRFYFMAMYYLGYLSYDKKTGRFTNTKTGTVYGPSKTGRAQITMYLPKRHGKKRPVTMLAYRLAWWLFKGPIPRGIQLNHKDGKKGNDRLSNLELNTNGQNQEHANRTGLRRVPRGELTGRAAKLTDAQVRKIKIALRNGVQATLLARKYKISNCTISNIKLEYSWAHIEI